MKQTVAFMYSSCSGFAGLLAVDEQDDRVTSVCIHHQLLSVLLCKEGHAEAVFAVHNGVPYDSSLCSL